MLKMLQGAIENIAGIQLEAMGGHGDALEKLSNAQGHRLSRFAELHLSHYTVGQCCSEELRQLWAEPRETASILEPLEEMLGRCPLSFDMPYEPFVPAGLHSLPLPEGQHMAASETEAQSEFPRMEIFNIRGLSGLCS